MPPTNSSVGTISGFSILPVQYDHATHHMLYIRAHVGSSSKKNSKKPDWPEGRTIFMVNVPPDATEREIVLLFKSCGTVEKAPRARKRLPKSAADQNTRPKVIPLPVIPHRTLRKTGHTAHILFLDASSCTRALALARPGGKPIQWPVDGDTECPRGLAHYVLQYEADRPSLDAVRAHGDSAVARFDFDLAARKAALRRESKYKKGEALVDEDGFTLVVRGGCICRKFMDERVKRKGHKEGNTFYAFQIHEKKRDALLELKRKWEEDKAAVEKLKSSKKFKPY
ncbi:ribosomal RNA-processing protein 7-domain-containing protein [Lactarius deliciosus]|nr:ribosomal RNA-processing protein 7-domain-containing protein [Lactarius deliciosus]